ncbi:MAG TPA: hypothetical protein VFD69_02975 [Vicinamibacterales bacterium]|nr:hypothetical protein [Vicinamibacterales bacterium]
MSGRRLLQIVMMAGLAVAMTAGRASAQAPAACDRACLRTMLDQYLGAVVKHDPKAAPLIVGFRQTENAVNVAPGNGVWKTVTGLGKMQRRYLDPVTGQAGYYGLIEEGSTVALATVRLRVQNRRLTEAEWYIARENDPGLGGPRQPGRPPANLLNTDYLIANPPPDRVVPAANRLSREELVAVTQSYFDAITSHDNTVALTHPGCGRAENGSPAPAGKFLPPAPRPAAAGAPAGPPPGGSSNDCVGGLANFNLSMVVATRIPLVDEEAQVTLGLAVFIRRPGSPTPRNVFSEWFYIEEGRIKTIYTSMFYPAATLAVPNWPPYNGNWPLATGIVPPPPEPRP